MSDEIKRKYYKLYPPPSVAAGSMTLIGNDYLFEVFKAGYELAMSECEEKFDKAKKALEFYGNRESWTVVEDYDGIVCPGLIAYEDIFYPDIKGPNKFELPYGGKLARKTLREIGE